MSDKREPIYWRHDIQTLIERLERAYEYSGYLRDSCELSEKNLFNSIRGDIGKVNQKLIDYDNTMSRDRAMEVMRYREEGGENGNV